MDEYSSARQWVTTTNRSFLDRPLFSSVVLTESKKKALHEALQNIEKKLEEMKSDTECAMEVLASNQEKMPVLHNEIQELKKLLNLNNVSRGTEEYPPVETEPQPSTSSTSDLLELSPNATNNNINLPRQFIFKRIRDGSMEDPSTKKPKRNSIDECVSMKISENTSEVKLPPKVEEAVQLSKGVLNPDELCSFLYLSRNLQNPVELAKVSFTMDFKLLYYQLLCLKFNLQKICDINDKQSSELREFKERLDVLIALFDSRT